jgi:hypothetical protein
LRRGLSPGTARINIIHEPDRGASDFYGTRPGEIDIQGALWVLPARATTGPFPDQAIPGKAIPGKTRARPLLRQRRETGAQVREKARGRKRPGNRQKLPAGRQPDMESGYREAAGAGSVRRGSCGSNGLPCSPNSGLTSPDSVLTTAEDGLLMTPRVRRTPQSLPITRKEYSGPRCG